MPQRQHPPSSPQHWRKSIWIANTPKAGHADRPYRTSSSLRSIQCLGLWNCLSLETAGLPMACSLNSLLLRFPSFSEEHVHTQALPIFILCTISWRLSPYGVAFHFSLHLWRALSRYQGQKTARLAPKKKTTVVCVTLSSESFGDSYWSLDFILPLKVSLLYLIHLYLIFIVLVSITYGLQKSYI